MTIFLNILMNTLPAAIVGLICFYFFRLHVSNEDKRRSFIIRRELAKQTVPIQLQAYERLTLLLERTDPRKLVLRVQPRSEDKKEYERLLCKQIEDEFEHNITQQVYVSHKLWNLIIASKNSIIQIIRVVAADENVTNSRQMAEQIITHFMEKSSPTQAALLNLKEEVRTFFR